MTQKSGLSPPAFPPQSVKIQSSTHASKLYAISYKPKSGLSPLAFPPQSVKIQIFTHASRFHVISYKSKTTERKARRFEFIS